MLNTPIDQVRHTKKFLMLIHDLLLSDDQLKIEDDPKYIRQQLSNDQALLNRLLEILSSDL